MASSEFDDSVYHLKRAASYLASSASDEAIEDAAIQYAFGIEKFAKAVLRTVNPIFELESEKFDVTAHVLYGGQMLKGMAKKTDDTSASTRVITLATSLNRSQCFSAVVRNYHGLFTKIGDYRSRIAHRKRSELDHQEMNSTMLRTFYPTVAAIASERGLDASLILGAKSDELKNESERLVALENRKERIAKYLAEHLGIWNKHAGDETYRYKADMISRNEADRIYSRGEAVGIADCPACSNQALVEYGPSEGNTGTGGDLFVTALDCYYCGLSLHDPEDIDFVRRKMGIEFL